ncbi:MAG: hypothetical protein QXM16_03200 [Nitrososphaerota archaeon]
MSPDFSETFATYGELGGIIELLWELGSLRESLSRISNKIHFYTVLSTYVAASIHIFLSITFPENR